jgi:hypothetical protein
MRLIGLFVLLFALALVVCAQSAPVTLTLLCGSPCNDSSARPGDQDCQRCLEYDCRSVTGLPADTTKFYTSWDSLPRIIFPNPSAVGQDDSVKITNHPKNVHVYYAMKSSNGRRWSAISNICDVYIETTPAAPNIRQRISFK